MKDYLSKARLFVITALGSAAVLAAGAFATMTEAQTTGTTTATGTTMQIMPVIGAEPTNAPAPMVTTIDQNGNILIRGVVQNVGTDALTLAGWGGTYTVRTTGSSQVTPLGVNGAGDVSGVTPGDFIGVEGVVAPDQMWAINASVVRDWTKSPEAVAPATTNTGTTSTDTPGTSSTGTGGTTSSSTSGIPTGDTLFAGTVSNVDATNSAFTLTDASGNTYTVTVNQGATIWDSASNTHVLSDVQNGDTIRLDGAQNGTSISADVVRDTSI